MKNLLSLAFVLSLVTFSVLPALADGDEKDSGGFTTRKETVCTTSYGGVTECTDTEIKEKIVHEATPSTDLTEINTGIAEMAGISTVLFLGGFAALTLAQKQLKV